MTTLCGKSSETSKTKFLKQIRNISEVAKLVNFLFRARLRSQGWKSRGDPSESTSEPLDSGFCLGGSQNELVLDSGPGSIRSSGFSLGGPRKSSRLPAFDSNDCLVCETAIPMIHEVSGFTRLGVRRSNLIHFQFKSC